MADPVALDAAAAAITGLVQTSPLAALGLGWMWLQKRKTDAATPPPERRDCAFAVGADGTLTRLDQTTAALIDLAKAQRGTTAQVASTLASLAASNELMMTHLREDADRLRRVEKEAIAALKYSDWVAGQRGSGS